MKTSFESQEVNLLAQSATHLRDRLLISLLVHTGSYISEALGLTGDDIHFDSSTLTIQHLKTRVTITCPGCNARLSRSSIYCPGCADEVSTALVTQREQSRLHTIPIDPHALTLFEEYIKRGGAVEKEDKNRSFAINRHRTWQIIMQCAARAGSPPLFNTQSGTFHNVSPHQLRESSTINAVKKNDSGDELANRYLAEFTDSGCGDSFHSFMVYFSGLRRVGWVEATGIEDPGGFQEYYPP
jgi:integrase/recombinase XerD